MNKAIYFIILIIVLVGLLIAFGRFNSEAPQPSFDTVTITIDSDTVDSEEHRRRIFRGFEVIEFATGLDKPVALAFDHKQRLFVALENGEIRYFVDRNKDADVESKGLFIGGFDQPRDIALGTNNVLYVSHEGGVSVIENPDEDVHGDLIDPIITDLPHGLHTNQAIAFGSANELFIAQGATTRDGSGNREALEASVLAPRLDGHAMRTFASGFYNPRGLGFDTEMNRLYATERSREDIDTKDNRVHVVNESRFYGWPECSGDQILSEHQEICADAITQSASFPFEWGIGQMLVYRTTDTLVERFPLDMQGGLFVIFEDKGSVELMRVDNTRGEVTVTPFAQGFTHPIDIAQGPIGSLFVADYEEGVIYKLRAIWD